MYVIGQKFEGTYPPEAAQWCNENGAMIVQVEGGFEIQPVPTKSKVDKIKAEIIDLETQQTPRRLREAALTEEGRAWLQNLEDHIAAKRAELAGSARCFATCAQS